MKDTIKLGSVELPLLDYVVGGAAILGIRDSGKTVTGKGIAEQLIDHNIPIFVFDAVGKWRWMKTPGPGKHGKGYKVVVAGGKQPDLPLNPHSVAEIVRSALKERIPLIIDLYDAKLSKADWRRIVQSAIRIIHYENDGGPCHVFLEEAAEYVPQKVQDGETYAEVEKFVRMGGNASVGITLINQRSQEVNKAVLDLCTTLILGCQVGSRAIEAVEKWVDRLDPATAQEVTQSLPKLASGEAWIWTRQNPDRPWREKLPMCRSFHPDRRTPESALKAAKGTDPGEFVQRMQSAIPKIIEEVKANDPRELQKQIAELKRQLATGKQPVKTETKEVPVLNKDAEALLLKVTEACDGVRAETQKRHEQFQELTRELNSLRGAIAVKVAARPAAIQPARQILKAARPHAESSGESNGELKSGEIKILCAAAQYPEGISSATLRVLTGFRGTSVYQYSKAVVASGYAIRHGDLLVATDAGIKALGSNYQPLPTGPALLEHWRSKLDGGEKQIFDLVVAAYPNSVTRQQIIDGTGYKGTSCYQYTKLLLSRRLFEKEGAFIKASNQLFQ